MEVDAEIILQKVLVFILALWCWQIGSHLETPYPSALVEAYAVPLTRIGLLIIVLLASIWSVPVGILTALAFVCLGTDVLFFGKPSLKIHSLENLT
jgi:hypothetical protein